MGDLPLRTRLYAVLLVFATSGLLVGSWRWSHQAWTRDNLLIAGILIVAIVLADRYQVSFAQTTGTLTASMNGVLLLAGGVLLGPFHGTLVAIAAEAISYGPARRTRLPAIKYAVNVANFGLSTMAGAAIYDAIANPIQPPLHDWWSALAIIVASLGFTVVNMSVLVVIVASAAGSSIWAMWQENFRGIYAEFVVLPALSTIVIVLAKANPFGIALLAVPLAGPHIAVRALQRNQQQTRATMEHLADALERRDPYTHHHSIRVTANVEAILDQMPEIPADMRQTILAGARIHDLGKVGTNNSSLNKPGKLTPDEWREMQAHAAIGAEIVGELDFYRESAAIVRHHHERWDGTGYPDGLAGEDIPLGARIIAVADTYDAMTSDRVYRRALTHEVAMAELRRGSGTQFDPQVVAAFERAMACPRADNGLRLTTNTDAPAKV